MQGTRPRPTSIGGVSLINPAVPRLKLVILSLAFLPLPPIALMLILSTLSALPVGRPTLPIGVTPSVWASAMARS